VDGNDVERVYGAAGQAIARLRKGNGPFFLECKTYRWHKHFLSDALPDLRPQKEIEAWKKKCPVQAYEKKLLKRKVLSPSRIKSMDDRILKKIEEAHAFALASPLPKPQDALQDIYSK
jgi:TPP-dependent pyruvate/acetoin dehydrogenase alpha subunit